MIQDAPISLTKRVTAFGIGALLFVGLILSGMIVEKVDANEVLVVQDALDGELHWYTTPGIKSQWFGRTTTFPKVVSYKFEGPIRFNEGGHGKVSGSVQFRLPLDAENLTDIYTAYSSAEALQSGLLSVVTDKSIFMTGPLLSSTESYAEKRSNLIFWIEDQIVHGVYRTTRRDVKIKDPITGEEKTATVAEIAVINGQPQRQESSQLEAFGVTSFNFAVAEVQYDDIVEKQIAAQQANIMAVQTAVAEARRAEQQALTAEQQGRSNATTARWAQEVEKAKAVTLAQQQLEVARLDAAAADQERLANERRGAGEAARRRALMQADNALSVKLDAYIKVMQTWAENVPKYQGAWVPNVVMGSATGGQQNGAQALIDMLSAKTARDLGLNLSTQKQD
jgi:hypothetical protein